MTSYDTGYRPRGWLPIKITTGIGGAVVAVAILCGADDGLRR